MTKKERENFGDAGKYTYISSMKNKPHTIAAQFLELTRVIFRRPEHTTLYYFSMGSQSKSY